MASRVEYRCTKCGTTFASRQALGGHRSHSLSCIYDNCHNNSVSSDDPPVDAGAIILRGPVITAPASPSGSEEYAELSIHQLLVRKTKSEAKHRITPTLVRPHSCAVGTRVSPYKLHEVRFGVQYKNIL